MASISSMAARRQLAERSLSASMKSIADQLGIEPPDDVPPGIRRNPEMCQVVQTECFSDFMLRASNAVAGLVETATAPRKKKNEHSNRVDQAAAPV